jgi:hypothetical protein
MIMTKEIQQIRELNDAELDAVTGGVSLAQAGTAGGAAGVAGGAGDGHAKPDGSVLVLRKAGSDGQSAGKPY